MYSSFYVKEEGDVSGNINNIAAWLTSDTINVSNTPEIKNGLRVCQVAQSGFFKESHVGIWENPL
jgi:hypothetical protein